MTIIKKYKLSVYLNTDNLINHKNKYLKKNPLYINYLQNKRMVILRNFLFIHSIFLTLLQFCPFFYKSELEFKIRSNVFYFLIVGDDYDDFFSNY